MNIMNREELIELKEKILNLTSEELSKLTVELNKVSSERTFNNGKYLLENTSYLQKDGFDQNDKIGIANRYYGKDNPIDKSSSAHHEIMEWIISDDDIKINIK